MNLRLGFLASHNGSNVKAILQNIALGLLIAEPKIIITNNLDANVIDIAKKYNVTSVCLNKKNNFLYSNLEEAILSTLINSDVNLVVLAGYMKSLGEKIIAHYKNKIVNIHPSLLPKYGGLGMYGIKVHKAVIESTDTESGATVHIVDPIYDYGRILSQLKVPRLIGDNAETLAKRVLEAEHKLYTQVLKEIQEDKIKI